MSHVFYSDDHGKSWQLGGTVADHTDECQVAELHDGRLMINMRNYWERDGGDTDLGGKRAVSISEDGGETWQALTYDSALVEPICQASLIKHSSDTFRQAPLIFANPASTTNRRQLTVRVSQDNGKTWPVARLIHKGDAAYCCLAVLPDRSVGCLYEADGYKRITFAGFTLPWLSDSSKDQH
jgi:sialidase-1